MVYWESETWQKWDNDATLPWSTIVVCLDDSVHNSVTNPILDLCLIDHRPEKVQFNNKSHK